MDQGFVDLRQNNGDAGSGPSFWPSFTDIMMVVVMIFILTSTVLIVRNWLLVAELRATLAAEAEARTAAAANLESSRSLEAQLTEARRALAAAVTGNRLLSEANAAQSAQLAERGEQLRTLGAEREQLAADLASLRGSAAALQEQVAAGDSRYAQLAAEHRQSAARLEEALRALAQLENSGQLQQAELATMRRERDAAGARLARLQGEYGTLEEKYRALFRPARSAEGKQVVEVRYESRGGAPQIELRAPGDSGFQPLSAGAMHRRLDALKAQFGQDLYVRIIIPPDSGLSYSEAWDFTRVVLDRYDYYFQD